MPAITDIAAYSTLETDFQPRLLVRNASNDILLDGFTNVASLAGGGEGVFFVPFRPNQSPQAWMYVAGVGDYQKISAPDAVGAVTTYKVGIEEPQQPVEAAPLDLAIFRISVDDGLWVAGGVAGSVTSDHLIDDTIGAVRQDPVGSNASRWSWQVSDNVLYQVGQLVYFDYPSPTGGLTAIQDVLPPINEGAPLEIDAIYYFSGSTGRCIIVPRQSALSTSLPQIVGSTPVSDSIFSVQAIANLRRGALVSLADYTGSPTEVVFILSVTRGPTGLISFECETTGTFHAGDTVTGVPTIVIDHYNASSGAAGDALFTTQLNFSLSGAGQGYVSHPLSSSPFTEVFDVDRAQIAQMDDYITFVVAISDLSKLVRGRIIFNVDPTVDYSTNIFYADFTSEDVLNLSPSLTVGAKAQTQSFDDFLRSNGVVPDSEKGGTFTDMDLEERQELQERYNSLYGNPSDASLDSETTVYPATNRAVIKFPIRALVRGGGNQNLTLANCNGVRLFLDVSGAVTAHLQEIVINGGGQCDVGRIGSPYFYCVRGRSPETGAVSNPSPISRYGVSPRRQQVLIEIEDFVGDPQMTMWDVFRIGGTVNTWRFVGTIANPGLGSSVEFTDDVFDTSIIGAPGLDFDNFEPWPSVDYPWTMVGSASINGTALVVAFTTAGDVPDQLLEWLPGTLILVSGVAYTLWNKPTLISGTTYLLRTVENMGFGTTTDVESTEPILGNQHLPYVWGPDASGTVFACGDPLRPGTLYFAKSNNPDAAPDTYNTELTNPSEPLVGGRVVNGIGYVSSSARWFALYPNFSNTSERYQKLERGIERPLAAPYGICDDGKNIYFWATDGIWAHNGAAGQSLTAGPLKNLFPHEGVNGEDVEYAGHTVYAPDYTYASQFRLAYAKGYLYADYRDSEGEPRTLVCDLTREVPAWIIDEYADPVIVHYLIEGPENNFMTVPSAQYDRLVMGDTDGNIWTQVDKVNDDGAAIECAVATFEYNGGDIRSAQFWGDAFLDSTPASGITVTPISNRIVAGPSTTIVASATRTQSVVKASGIESKSLGILTEWNEDFDYLADEEVTKLFGWQPMYQAVPISVFRWQTQATSFGMDGYGHIREILATYKSTADVVLTITVFDGNSPANVTLPSTGGQVQKVLFPVTFNKGLLYSFDGVSTAPWTPYFDSWEFHVGQWGRTDGYRIVRDIEAPKGLARGIE